MDFSPRRRHQPDQHAALGRPDRGSHLGTFGNLTGPLETPGSRKIQLGAKFNF